MWGKCGVEIEKSSVQIEKSGVWAWCLKVPFAVPKTSKCSVKILFLGVEDVKSQQTSPNIWKVNAQKEQIAAAILYCHVLLLKTQQPTTWNTLMGTQPQPSP